MKESPDFVESVNKFYVLSDMEMSEGVHGDGDDGGGVPKQGGKKRRKKAYKGRGNWVAGFLNVNSGRRQDKWNELKRVAKVLNMDAIAIAETHLRDDEQPKIWDGWTWFGKNRIGPCTKKGGGIGIFVKDGDGWELRGGECDEHMWITGKVGNLKVALAVVYLECEGGKEGWNEKILSWNS